MTLEFEMVKTSFFEKAAVNLSFFTFKRKPFVPSK